jgi:Na+/phosphate symporter
MSNLPSPLKKLSDDPRTTSASFWILATIAMIIAGFLLIKFLEWFVPWFIPEVDKSYYRKFRFL